MKVALVATPGYSPPFYGGQNGVINDLATELIKKGHSVTLVAPNGNRLEGGDVIETGKPVKTILTHPFDSEYEAYLVYRDKLNNFDIIHGHTWFALEYLCKVDNPHVKVCHTHHGHVGRKKSYSISHPFKLNFCVLSEYMAEEYRRNMGSDCRVVYNGVDINHYFFKAEKGERLLFVGRLRGMKQPHVAIEVAKKLDMPIDLIGGTYAADPNYVDYIKSQCDGNQIRLFLDAPEELKVKLMQEAKALLFPSCWGEPFGLVAVESLATGTPVIAMSDGAIPEIIRDGLNGYICKTVEEMAEAVKRVDEIKPENCRRTVEENFTQEMMAERYLKIYRDVLNGDEW